jgi:hypothetical protein
MLRVLIGVSTVLLGVIFLLRAETKAERATIAKFLLFGVLGGAAVVGWSLVRRAPENAMRPALQAPPQLSAAAPSPVPAPAPVPNPSARAQAEATLAPLIRISDAQVTLRAAAGEIELDLEKPKSQQELCKNAPELDAAFASVKLSSDSEVEKALGESAKEGAVCVKRHCVQKVAAPTECTAMSKHLEEAERLMADVSLATPNFEEARKIVAERGASAGQAQHAPGQ